MLRLALSTACATLILLLAGFSGVAQAQSVTVTSVTNSSPSAAAGARTVYTITFTTSVQGALSGADSVTITFPAGTDTGTLVGPSSLTDVTAGKVVGDCFSSSATVATCVLFGGDSIAAGDEVSAELDGVTNPGSPTGGPQTLTLTVSTTSDPTAVTSPTYVVQPSQQVSGVSVSEASPSAAAGARTVYTVGFTASGFGGLSAAADSDVTITFPAGTDTGTLVGPSSLTDVTAGKVVGDCFSSSATVAICVFFGGDSIAAGDQVSAELDGITNPASGSTTLKVGTTSDVTPVTSPSYVVQPKQQVSGVSVSEASPSAAAGARTVYTVGFTASGFGGLSAAADSDVTITFPAGTDTGTLVGPSSLTDVTAGKVVGDCFSSSATVAICVFFGGDSIAAGDQVSAELDGITNPASGSTTLKVGTTSDVTPVTSPSYVVQPKQQVSGVSVSEASPSAAAGARTVYTVGFTASGFGGLSAAADSDVTITFPAGTDTGTLVGPSSLTDVTAGKVVGDRFSSSATVAICVFFGGDSIAAGDEVSAELDGITNPAAGSKTLTLSTTSDTTPVTSPAYVVQPLQKVSTLAVTLSSSAPGAVATYTVGFTASGFGGLSAAADSDVTITFPAGTDTGTLVGPSLLTDVTAGKVVGDCFSSSATVAICVFFGGDSIAAGDEVSAELDGVTNPAAGSKTLTVSTTSDTTSGHVPVIRDRRRAADPDGQRCQPKLGFGAGRSNGDNHRHQFRGPCRG